MFIWDEEADGIWQPGSASRWWLHHSLASLEASLAALGSYLHLARGYSEDVIMQVAKETGARALYCNRCYEPIVSGCDDLLIERLASRGVEVHRFNASLLFDPEEMENKQGRPFQVFTAFWRHCQEQLASLGPGSVKSKTLRKLSSPPGCSGSLSLDALGLLPSHPWTSGFSTVWDPGEKGARQRLKHFLSELVSSYDTARDKPAEAGTSGLSPHLHYGEIGPGLILAEMQARALKSGVFPANKGEQRFLAELGWREFSHHLLMHFPETPTRPLRPDFERFPWEADPDGLRLKAWQKGQTGYPIVDAGMRQLWSEGWMHNRVRMICASFLVKHLRLPWQKGAEWFWDTLVDADLANNTLGWQWSAGCGADAAPYFRIFNPTLQGEKFDTEGDYVRRWVPELASLPGKWIHRPWEAPGAVLVHAGVSLGSTYPMPIVDHAKARIDALAAFQSLKRGTLLSRKRASSPASPEEKRTRK